MDRLVSSFPWQVVEAPHYAHILRSTSPHPDIPGPDVFMITVAAYKAVQMELVDDRSIPLSTQIRTNFDKLCAYFLTSNYLRGIGEYGSMRGVDVEANPQLYHQHIIRKAYFHQVKQVLYDLFLKYLRYGLISRMPQLQYNSENQIFIDDQVHYHNFSPDFDQRRPPRKVCWPGDKKPAAPEKPESFFDFTNMDVKRFGKPINFTEPGSNLTAHHIISLNLLNKFFEIHAELEKVGRKSKIGSSHIDNRYYNILNHSQRKLLTIRLWIQYCNGDPVAGLRTSAPPQLPGNAQMDDIEKFVDHLGRVFTWSTGANLFLGPLAQERGPFDPSKRGLDFEFDAKSILSEEKYEVAFKLYQQIDQFLKLEPKKRRPCDSSDIFNSIFSYYLMFNITPYNEDQWEKRILTVEELSSWPRPLAKKNRGKEFWAIKREDLQSSPSIRRPFTSIGNNASPPKRRRCNKE